MNKDLQESLVYDEEWYNLEDRTNYVFASYLIITETDDTRDYHLIENYEDALKVKTEFKNNKKYSYVSKIWKTNKKTINTLYWVKQK
jgi:hypothetical protein